MEEPIPGGVPLNPWALGLLVSCVLLTLLLPRRVAILPLLVTIGLMPMGQEIVAFGLNFYLFRVLLLVGIARIVLRGELSRLQWTGLDKLFLWWCVVTVLFGSLSDPSQARFLNRAGEAFNAIAFYLFARAVIVDREDAVRSVRMLAWLSLPIAALMMVEWSTGSNPLAAFGGVPEAVQIRDGELRCQGAFRHPILAGAYGAAQVPLFLGLAFGRQGGRTLPLLGVAASLLIVFTSSSSGAVLALGAAIAGFALWQWRASVPALRNTLVFTILALALVMNAPVWYLIARLSNVVGGTGWHRAWVIDQALTHLDEWWLFGTTYTAHWGPSGEVIAADPNMMDITNHYVMEGVKGGALKLVLFVAIIVTCYRRLGRTLAESQTRSRAELLFAWSVGVSIFTHCVAFISVNYFDQTVLVWYWLIALTCAVTQPGSIAAVAPPKASYRRRAPSRAPANG